MNHQPEPQTAGEWLGLWGCGLFAVMVFAASTAIFAGAAVWLFSQFLPLWSAVVLGVPLGLAVLALFLIGESTVMEKAVRCFILLILCAINWPVLEKARQNAQKNQARALQKQTQK